MRSGQRGKGKMMQSSSREGGVQVMGGMLMERIEGKALGGGVEERLQA